MTLSVIQLPLGPLQTNCYLMACTVTQQAAVIDPAWDGRALGQPVGDVTLALVAPLRADDDR